METTIAVIAPGVMGSAVGRRLKESGATVLTSLTGRSPGSRARADAAGMADAADDAIARADVILSILPPDQALGLAQRLAGPLSQAPRKAVFADCNAVNVETVKRIAAVVAPTGAAFVDGGIIGPPPGPSASPVFYFSGEAAPRLAMLNELGLAVEVMTAPVGAASALKMSYGGFNKGVTLLAAAMVLGATRAGAADAFRSELARSLPQQLARMTRTIPDMYAKAYRWAPEMEEISEFLGDDPAARRIFEGMAELCRRLAADHAGERSEVASLDAFVGPGKPG